MVVLGSSEIYMVVVGSVSHTWWCWGPVRHIYMVVLGSSESYIHGGVGVQ